MKTYNIYEVAEILKLHWQTVLARVNSGEIKAFKTGRKWVVLEEDLKQYISDRSNQGK